MENKKTGSLGAWLAHTASRLRRCRKEREAKKLGILSYDLINVVEFEGYIYVAFNGVPIVKQDYLNIPITELLAEARNEYLTWKEKLER